VIEKDVANGMCLVRYVNAHPPEAELYYDRVQCSCEEPALPGRHLGANAHLLLQTQHPNSTSPSSSLWHAANMNEGDLSFPDIWLRFGPTGVLDQRSTMDENSHAVTGEGVHTHQWMHGSSFGVADLDGTIGEVVVSVSDMNQPFMAASEGALTVSAWIRLGEARPGAGIQLKDTDGLFGSALSVDSDGHFVWFVQDSQSNFRGPHSRSTAPVDDWIHVAGVFEDGCMSLYLNGTRDARECDKKGFQTLSRKPTVELVVGHYHTPKHNIWFKGSFADIRVYSKALADADIVSLMREPLASGSVHTL